jgi:beta-fructofuranosidase
MSVNVTCERWFRFVLAALTAAVMAAQAAAEDAEGFKPIFDGATLNGWKAPDMSYWSVEEGAITGRITKEHPLAVNQYLVWRDAMDDFELKVKSRVLSEHSVNSGFQFRSKLLPNSDIAGYQVDNQTKVDWLVRLYDEHGRHTLAMRGTRAVIDEKGRIETGKLPGAEGPGWFKLEDWHEYHLVCQGPRLTLLVDGRLAAEVTDNDPEQQDFSGILGLQLHSAPPMTVQFKDIRLKTLKKETPRVAASAAPLPGAIAAAQAQEVNRLIEPARQMRTRLLNDRNRPTYHIVTPEGLCGPFDPNGAIFWKGRYHLMYIVQTQKGHCWAHISSKDLIHWRHHPLALEPGDGDSGIFSGGAALDKNGVPTITYWGLGSPGGICTAASTDENLDRWTKNPHNPLIRETQGGLTVVRQGDKEVVYGAADPSAIWVKDGRHYLLTGNLLVQREFGHKRKMPEHLGDTLYLFSSDDLTRWTYLHPFYQSDRKWTAADEDDMCPDFFPLPASPEGGRASDRHMILFISHNHGCQYYVGRYADDRFRPETHGRMTWVDNAFFAPESLVDDRGRRIMWSWIFDGRTQGSRQASGWSGEMSLPRVLWLGEDNTLRMRVPEELKQLRYHEQTVENLTVEADKEVVLDRIAGNTIELLVEIEPGAAQQCGVQVCRSPDGQERTLVYYDAADRQLKIDVTKASLGEGPKNVEAGPLALKQGETLSLRVFVDKSVVEAFANDRQAAMRRIYPTRPDSVGVTLFARGGSAKVRQVKAWEMFPSNPY